MIFKVKISFLITIFYLIVKHFIEFTFMYSKKINIEKTNKLE